LEIQNMALNLAFSGKKSLLNFEFAQKARVIL